MALPFLTEEEIHPTFVGIHLELLGVTDLELELVSSFILLNNGLMGVKACPFL